LNSARDLATGFSGVATSGFALYMGLERMQTSQYAVEKANYAVERAAKAVEDAQNKYNEAVAKYGPESDKAQEAAKNLQLAQERYQLATERAELVQRNANNTIMQFAISVVPSMITMVTSGITAFQNFGAATQALSGAMSFLAANPIVLVIAGIAALAMGLIYAYNTCEPFRNAVNAIGAAIMGFLKPAVDVITGALNWLWNNVVSPFIDTLKKLWDTITSNPILSALFGPITTIAFLITHWDDVTKALRDGLDFLWNRILKPIGDFLISVFKVNIDIVGGAVKWLWDSCFKPLQDGLQWLWDHVLKPLADWLSGTFKPIVDSIGNAVGTIKGAVDTVGGAMKGFTDTVGGAMSSASNAISGFIGSICFAHAIHNAVESSTKDLDKWVGAVKDSMSKGVESVKGFVAEVGTPTLTVGGVTGAPAYPPVLPASHVASSQVNVNITVQGVQEEIADYVRTRLTKELKDTLIEATSSAAPFSKKILLPKTFVR
jgi:phage-related protein